MIGIFHDGRTYAFAFGAFFGVMELVPFIGPVLGAIPPIAVALFENPLTALWVVLLFIVLQQLEGHVVAPQIFSHALRINPLLVIIALLFGDAIYGIIGALMALPGRGGDPRDDPLPAPARGARAVAHPGAAADLMAAPTLEARSLSKRFGERVALRDVSFELAGGEILAVIGPNGAGKTTLLSLLAGASAPSSGEVIAPGGRADRLGAPADRRLLEALGGREPAAVRPPRARRATPRRRCR